MTSNPRAGSAAAGPSSTTRASRSASTSPSSPPRTASSSACSVGVSPVLFYDPAERVIATLHPNHTYEKVVFDPWQQTTYDVNDTCAAAQRADRRPAHRPRHRRLRRRVLQGASPATWQTWHAAAHRRRTRDRTSATPPQRAAAHADTPTTAHFDALGRPFLTVARNRVVCAGHDLDGTEDSFATRVELDIEGNQRAVRDANPATAGDRARPHRHALRLRHARQPHPPAQHGGRRALDAERRGRQAHPRLGQPRPQLHHHLRRAAPPGRADRARHHHAAAPTRAR